MPTRATEHRNGFGAAAKEVAERASTIAKLELELAATELKAKAAALGLGVAMLLGAAVFGLFAFGFLLATAAAALATFLPTWLALLLVAVFLLLTAGLLAVIGLKSVKRGTPPVPRQAIQEARLTTTALKSDG